MPAVNCTDDPPIALNDDRGFYDWDLKNKSYTLEIKYTCRRDGWGFPSSGSKEKTAVCQSNQKWSMEGLETCTGKEESFIVARH